MNATAKKTTVASGTVIYQPHRLQQSGCAPVTDSGIQFVFGMEPVGKESTVCVHEVEDFTPVNILTVW
jgi:hypothetical protein